MPAERPVPLIAPAPGTGDIRPVPDPTVLTTQQLLSAISAVREVIETRLAGMDKAIDLLQGHNDKLRPMIMALLDEKVNHLQALHEEKFAGIQVQFKERDTRSERESRDNKVAVDAAFAAQKEAAARQDEANAKAIDKSERATTETIKTNQELTKAATDNLTKDVDSLKLAVNAIQAAGIGQAKAQDTGHASSTLLVSIVAAVIGLVGLVTAIVVGLKH